MSTKSTEAVKQQMHKARKRATDRGRRFRKMTRNQQRVAIAKDVLNFLDTKKFTATRGIYLSIDIDDKSKKVIKEFKTTLSGLLSVPTIKCEVCAIGAVFTAAVCGRGVDRKSSAVQNDWGNLEFSGVGQQKMISELEPYFDEDELRDMEYYFENMANRENSDTALKRLMDVIIESDGESIINVDNY